MHADWLIAICHINLGDVLMLTFFCLWDNTDVITSFTSGISSVWYNVHHSYTNIYSVDSFPLARLKTASSFWVWKMQHTSLNVCLESTPMAVNVVSTAKLPGCNFFLSACQCMYVFYSIFLYACVCVWGWGGCMWCGGGGDLQHIAKLSTNCYIFLFKK